MKQPIVSDFIIEWNKSHKRFNFTMIPDISGKPVSIEVRYSAARYRKLLTLENWQSLTDIVVLKSRGTMYVVTDEHLFERGIIEIKVASQNHNYQNRHVISVLKWIGEELFIN